MSVKVCSGCGAASDRKLCNVCRSEGKTLPARRCPSRSTTQLAGCPDNFPSYQRELDRAREIRAQDPEGWEVALPLHGAVPAERPSPSAGEWAKMKKREQAS